MNKKIIIIGIMLVFLMPGLSGCNEKKSNGDIYSYDNDTTTNDSDDYVGPEEQLKADIEKALEEVVEELISEKKDFLQSYFEENKIYRSWQFEDEVEESAEKKYPELEHKFVVLDFELYPSGNYFIDYGYHPYSNSDEGFFGGNVDLG